MSENKKQGKPKKKSNAGRPTVMTEAVIGKLVDLFSKGLSDREACLIVGIDPSTLYDYCNTHTEFAEQKELLKEKPKTKAKLNIAACIEKGDIELSKWYLERKAKAEFSTKQDIDLSGSVNNPFEGLSTEELKKLIESE